jgi:pyridoxamine 5'-phosphate oxidase
LPSAVLQSADGIFRHSCISLPGVLYFCSMNSTIAAIRSDYKMHTLTEDQVEGSPIRQFSRWWDEAIASEIYEVNAMTLATASADGVPSARIVLLKDFDEQGFVFFTNYESEKGREIAANPRVSLLFFWKELERQVRINGTASKIAAEESDAYFNSRPAGSRIGALASPQSKVVSSREELELRYSEIEKQFAEGEIVRPAHWGGYRVKPDSFEFWQGRSSRMHDRICYRGGENGSWRIERLAP